MQDRVTTPRTEIEERPLALQLALEMGLAVAFCAAMIITAKIRIPLPFTPVPITLQTLAVLLAGAFLGPRVGLMATMGYLLLSLLGLPVLTLTSFIGPSGGYVLGFVLAAVMMGYFARRGTLTALALGAGLASLTILLCGSLWLSAYTDQNLRHAFLLGMAPFLAGDALKSAAAVMIVRLGRRQFASWARIL
ncbi:MAG: biotin transporter BioY [Armatimonadia bacterium]